MTASTAYMLEKKEGIHPKTNIGGKSMAKNTKFCPYCGSDNISWMGDAFGDFEDGTPKMYCHHCEGWFGVKSEE